ncbi:MAG: hypothetical protein KatS3mg118_3452 [Paracoccaceae bacterium]|nr:MAG: hypothetical protein KatS3mg118_3452 [Paracoccaceae bacterium]
MSETIVIGPRPGLAEAEQLLDTLRALPPEGEVTFDAAAVESLPAACALVIAAFARHRPETAPKPRVRAPSREFVDAFSDLGLFQDLMKMEFGK